jgi:hypothetical protein
MLAASVVVDGCPTRRALEREYPIDVALPLGFECGSFYCQWLLLKIQLLVAVSVAAALGDSNATECT